MTQGRAVHALVTLALLYGTLPALAQYGTPEHLRRMVPTIEDRDPGQAGDEGELTRPIAASRCLPPRRSWA